MDADTELKLKRVKFLMTVIGSGTGHYCCTLMHFMLPCIQGYEGYSISSNPKPFESYKHDKYRNSEIQRVELK